MILSSRRHRLAVDHSRLAGIGQLDTALFADPAAGIYVDGVFVGTPAFYKPGRSAVGTRPVIGYHPPMIESLRKKTGRWLLAALVLTVSGCASGGSRETPMPAAGPGLADATLFGVAGDHFVSIDAVTGLATELTTSPDLWEVGALTYDPASHTFYAVAHSATDPELIAIDRDSGDVRKIGPIDMPTLDLTLVEGLAFDPVDGILYATGSRSRFASERLLTLDVANGEAHMIGKILGTPQNDVDALVAIGGKLYGVDTAGNSGAVYEIDKRDARASLQPRRFPRAITDLAFEPEGRRLLATVDGTHLLLSMATNGQVSDLGPTHSEAGLGGWPISAIACIDPATGLFDDDFESGDLASWTAGKADDEPSQ